MRIIEEIVILILDRETGTFRHSLSEHHRNLVIAGAVMMDLAFERRIDTDPHRLLLLDPAAVNDDILDPVLADIAAAEETREPAWWLDRVARHSPEILDNAVTRLSEQGILSCDEDGGIFLSRLVSRLRRYPKVDGHVRDDIETRVLRTVLGDDIPDARDTMIIALASACNIFEAMLSSEELAEARERIKLLSRMDLMGRIVADSVRAISAPSPLLKTVRPWEEVALVPGLPLIGSGLQMLGDLHEFMLANYQTHGPIFRVRAMHREFTVLAGPEANKFVKDSSAVHFRNSDSMSNFCVAMGARQGIVALDGPEHMRMRKLLAKGYTPKSFVARLDAVREVTRSAVADWPEDRPIGIQNAMKRIIAEQIGLLSTGASSKDHIDDLSVYLDTLISVHVMGYMPAFVKRLPRFRRAERRLKELADNILAAHAPENREGVEPDLIDHVLEMNRLDPQLLPETDLFFNVIAPFFAGLDTSANCCAFMLYSLFKHPRLLERVQAEADVMFERGPLSPESLKVLDVTNRAVRETMRMYPITSTTFRIVTNSFGFAGYRVPAGKEVLIVPSVGNHLPDCFPEPRKFDIERWAAPRAPAAMSAFEPFSVGRHRCLAASLAELQVAFTIATIVREVDLVLDNPDRAPKIIYLPTRHFGDSTTMRIALRRSATAPAR